MYDAIHTALLFLINTLFSLYAFILMLRILLVFVRSNYFNPLTQLVVRFTDFFIKPLRRFLPNVGQLELASIVSLFSLEIIKLICIALLAHHLPTLGGVILLAIADMLKLLLETLFYAILIQAIFSWIQPFNPINQQLQQLTAPIMRPIQRIVPPIGGFDISPIPAILLLQLLIILLVGPLTQIGLSYF